MGRKPAERTTEDPAPFITIASETLMGDLRDFVLDRLKHDHEALPWDMRGEQAQRETIASVESAMRTWVFRAVTMLASEGQKAARGSLIKFVVKDGIQMQINLAASDSLRHELQDHVGGSVLVIIADVDQHQGERSAVKVKPDQGAMDIDIPEDPAEAV